MIEIYSDLDAAIVALEELIEMYYGDEGLVKGEILQLPDGRWRVGVSLINQQLELDV